MSFATVLKERRQALGLTTTQCAEMLGVTQPAWNQWELGLREPKFERLRDICRVLDVSSDALLEISLSPRASHSVVASGHAVVAVGRNARASSISHAAPVAPSCAKCPYKRKLSALEKLITAPASK